MTSNEGNGTSKDMPVLVEDGKRVVLMRELYCSQCGRFLARHAIKDGIVQVKCRGCKEWSTLEITPQ